eukprot:gb/GECG01005265.1/.p1 GENE.gb/GECG01005265.1/~~gb/GECG01005265.1/.p1  ORF type:complete len:616 (+),score=49.19 gb/GECG01005265.1/:1-1848(+)
MVVPKDGHMPAITAGSTPSSNGSVVIPTSDTREPCRSIEESSLLGDDREDSGGEQPPGNDFLVLIPHLAAPVEAGIQPARTIGVVSLAFLAYVSVCGGPFGIEPAVGAAGPLITLIALIVAGIFWALPQSLLTAELSTIYDENGGYIVWVQESLGPFWGFVNGQNALVANLCDLPSYVVLYASYLQQFFHMSLAMDITVKFLTLALVVTLNVLGMETVAITSIIFTMIVLTPFAIEPFMASIAPEEWSGVKDKIDWGVLVATVLWNYQGWNTLGCVAGEVKNAKRSYPIGVLVAIAMVVFTYAIPIMVGVVVEPEWEQWGDEVDFVDIAGKIAKWLGIFTLLGASLALIGEFSAALSSSSRALQRMAGYGMVPKFLVKNKTRFATPVPSILFEAAATGGLMFFDISTLMIITTLFNNISIVMQIISFLYLRYKYPEMKRPYKVPCGKFGAVFVTIPQILVVIYATYSFGIGWQVGLGLGLNVLYLIAAYWWAYKYLPQVERRYTAEHLAEEVKKATESMEMGAIETQKTPDRHGSNSGRSPLPNNDRRRSYDSALEKKSSLLSTKAKSHTLKRSDSTSNLPLCDNDSLQGDKSPHSEPGSQRLSPLSCRYGSMSS